MTIDLDAIEYAVGKTRKTLHILLELDPSDAIELLRLARLGQQRERERCEACIYYEQSVKWCYKATGQAERQNFAQRVSEPSWHCADWQEREEKP